MSKILTRIALGDKNHQVLGKAWGGGTMGLNWGYCMVDKARVVA